MWVDGIDIVKQDLKCFTVDNMYIFITDENGKKIYATSTSKIG